LGPGAVRPSPRSLGRLVVAVRDRAVAPRRDPGLRHRSLVPGPARPGHRERLRPRRVPRRHRRGGGRGPPPPAARGRAGGGGGRAVRRARLAAVDSLYAITIHKAQGSQFGSVVVVLPEPTSPILTRELLYTGVTRAQSSLTVVGSEASVRAAVARPVARAS